MYNRENLNNKIWILFVMQQIKIKRCFFIFSFNKYKCGIEIKINKVCFQIKIHSQLSVKYLKFIKVKVVLLDIAI